MNWLTRLLQRFQRAVEPDYQTRYAYATSILGNAVQFSGDKIHIVGMERLGGTVVIQYADGRRVMLTPAVTR